MLVPWRVMLYENDVRIFQPTNFLQVVWSSASFRLIAESKRALTSVKNCRFDLLSIGIKCGEIKFQVHSGRLNIAMENEPLTMYFLLLLQHVQYFHCYVSLHEASYRFFSKTTFPV